MEKILNFLIGVWSLPKKFWQHCFHMACCTAICSLADTLLDLAHQYIAIEHYVPMRCCIYVILALGNVWFVRRAYIGLERDMDFYED